MTTLVVNAGSSSHKLVLFGKNQQRLWSGAIDWSHRGGALSQTPTQLQQALAQQLQTMEACGQPCASVLRVGHRIVHGGERFLQAVELDTAVIAALEQLRRLAPLHNGPALDTLTALTTLLAGASHAAAFDTAFHRSLPPEASTYALPAEWRQRGLHRFGFHGLSHGAIARRFPRQRLISCHLGAGCSLAVIKAGHCLDTTMGFSPLDGLVMATRSGSLDPGLILELLSQGLSLEELRHGLQQRSGLLGLSGISGDMRELRQLAATGHPQAQLAIAVFQHQLLKAIGAGLALLGGVEALVLTGGIGEHDQALHGWLAPRLAAIGLPPITLIPADEELEILRQISGLQQPADRPVASAPSM
jgi:acetate kinase